MANRTNRTHHGGLARVQRGEAQTRRRWPVWAAAVAALLFAGPAGAVMLMDNGSTIEIDPFTQDGIKSWIVNGNTPNQLPQEWFWFRVGATGGEASIDTLPNKTMNLLMANKLNITFADAGLTFKIDITLTLNGDLTPGVPDDLIEMVTITNTKVSGDLEFHLFEYTNLDLRGTPNDDSGIFSSATTVTQTDLFPPIFSTTVTGGTTKHAIVTDGSILADLNDGNPTDLGIAVNVLVGPGDVSWAFQYDSTIGPGQSTSFTKTKTLLPEPSPLTLLGLGMLGLTVAGRRRHAR